MREPGLAHREPEALLVKARHEGGAVAIANGDAQGDAGLVRVRAHATQVDASR